MSAVGGVDVGVSEHVKDNGNVFRMSLSNLAFYPLNRGGRGVDPGHAHDVCHDGVQNTVKQFRYKHIHVAEIPHDLKGWILNANQKLCNTNKLMPAFSPTITHVCLTGTHLVHAGKLVQDGNRTYMNSDHVKLIWTGDEADMIRERGILVKEYKSGILRNEAVLSQFMWSDDILVSDNR